MPPSASGFDPVQVIAARVREAIVRAFPGRDEAGTADPMITPGRNPALGDFQSNAAMALGKALGLPPRQVAQAIIANLDPGELLEPLSEASAAGPGFINFRLRSPALGVLLDRLESARLGLEPPSEPRTVVVDLCGVNLAKQMHVGHLRSTIIGDALARTLERLGHRVVRQNHVGDWGLPIAMVTAKLRDQAAAGAVDPDRLTLDGLESLYRRAQLECAADERGLAAARRSGHPKALAELEAQVEGATGELARAKATLLRLQAHDPETVAWWRRVYDITMAACLATVRRLHADIDEQDSAGESSYAHELAPLADDLRARGIAEESDGALVVRVEGLAEPCLVRKSDGGYLYATTDLAAIRRRVWTLGAERVIYCVDARQALHFKQVFAAARRAGYATNPATGRTATLEHAAFGMVLGEDNRPLKTRSGQNVKLADLIDEAHQRAERTVAEKSPDLSEAERGAIAEAVAIAALRYADLSTDRSKDYVFSFDRMLAFEGNTGPYLLYALVRVRSIFRKAAAAGVLGAPAELAAAPLLIAAPQEKDLALALLRYPGTIRGVAESLEPHRLCQYLYDLATAFSALFTACPVIQAPEPQVRASRLRLCSLTQRVLEDGLAMLGIRPLERM